MPSRVMRALRRALLPALGLVSLAGVVLWMAHGPDERIGDVAAEREVREFIRELERDLQRNFQFEMRIHLVHDDGSLPDGKLDERAHAVIDTLAELAQWKRLRISGVKVAISGSKALVQFTVRGDAADAGGHFNPSSKALLLRLEKYGDAWKITDVFPRPEAS